MKHKKEKAKGKRAYTYVIWKREVSLYFLKTKQKSFLQK